MVRVEPGQATSCGAADDVAGLFFLLPAPLLCGAATTVRLTAPARFLARAAAGLAATAGALMVMGI